MKCSTKRRVAVVADDITGANDIGIMFAKKGMRAAVMPFKTTMDTMRFAPYDVVVLDTDSRFDAPDAAAEKVRQATRLLMNAGFDLFYNKTCSVFRGNIGAAFDAMQDTLGQDCSMIVLGFPKMKRTTVEGIHYLDGELLEQSPFKNDPIHPANESRLQKILARQSARKSALFTHEMLDGSIEEQRQKLGELKAQNAYVIFDVRHQADLRTIAELICQERNICGSSAIAEELPMHWGYQALADDRTPSIFETDGKGTLVLAGSLTVATKGQVDCFKRGGGSFAELDPYQLMEKASQSYLAQIINAACESIERGRAFLIHSSNERETVLENKQKALALGMDAVQLGRLISKAMGQIAKEVLDRTGARKLVVAGGDTSMAVNEALGIDLMKIISEIEPGVPAMVGEGHREKYAVVYKSGSFGTETFFEKAIKAINLSIEGS